MKVSYDPEHDVLYVHFKDGPAAEVVEAEDGVILELDESKGVMGLEIWNANRRGLLAQLTAISK